MTPWKIILPYIIPTFILGILLFSNLLSRFGLIEKWLYVDDEIYQVISVLAISASNIEEEVNFSNEAEEWSNNGFDNSKEHSMMADARVATERQEFTEAIELCNKPFNKTRITFKPTFSLELST